MHVSILTVFRHKQLILPAKQIPSRWNVFEVICPEHASTMLIKCVNKIRLIKSTAVYFETDSLEGIS